MRELDVGSELRSLFRNLVEESMNANNLQAAVEPRRGDVDGRGNLTMSGLIGFCINFLARLFWLVRKR